jgi:8-oxo-dGTP diphosphatase
MKNDRKSMNPKDIRFAVLATDVVLFTVEDNVLKVLLIDVNLPPYFVNTYGVPGGLVLPTETADDSVSRHVKNKVGLHVPYLEQLYTFSSVKRDPRGRVVSVAYLGLISSSLAKNGGLRAGVFWRDVGRLPKLAYDHSEIVKMGIERLLSKLGYTTIVQFLLPKEFTLPELQRVYEVVFRKEYDKRNFRKKIFTLGVLKKTGKKRKEGAFRPAELYSFRVGVDKVFEIL